MDIAAIKGRLFECVKKYKYVIVVLLVGIVLMCLPATKTDTVETQPPLTSQPTQDSFSEQLEALLSSIQGAGRVQVLLSKSAGERYVYQVDSDTVQGDNSSTVRIDTVIVSDNDRNEKPLVVQIIPPTYSGAVVICQGGDLPQVQLAIINAVSKATALGADQICVLKMK